MIQSYHLVLPSLVVMASRLASAQETAGHEAVDAAIAAVKPALVRIHVAESRFRQGRESKAEAAGSGVIISAGGYVVTNHHVAGHAKRLLCTLTNKDEVEADLVGTDPLTDISVLKLRTEGARRFPFANWGDSSKLRVGDSVFAMGSPLALSQSVTRGIVSNTEMTMPDILSEGALTLEGEDVGSMVRWIGHDALIAPGNSGGPLVSVAGEVVGINEIELGLSGAIPSNIAKLVAAEIIRDGHVRRATLGISVQPLLKSMPQNRGILVSGVLPKSAASEGGMKAGDVIVKLADSEIVARFAEEIPLFNQKVASLPIGQKVPVVVLRDGKEETLTVAPTERSPAEPEPVELAAWGLVVSDITEVQARERKLPSTAGVLVQSVRSGGPSGNTKPAVQAEDIVEQINGQPVKNVAELQALTKTLTAGQKDPLSVLVAFKRGDTEVVTVVQVGAQGLEDPGREARKAYLPVSTQVLTPEIAKALKAEGKKGFRITRVQSGSTAAKAGLRVGDLILAVDGQALEASQPEDAEALNELIRQYDIGAKVDLKILRAGAPVTAQVVLEESPLLPREMHRFREEAFEFTVRELASEDRNTMELDPKLLGVLVEEVADGGWASLGKLEAGDVITSVNGETIKDLDGFKTVMAAVRGRKPQYVVLRVQRGIQELFLEFVADWSKK